MQEKLLSLRREAACLLAPGVTCLRQSYDGRDGAVEAYTLIVAPDAAADIRVSAAPLGQARTVPEHAAAVPGTLAAVNAGFFHLAAGTLLPYGLQIVDGRLQHPLGQDGQRSFYWFGVTKDGRRVLSDLAGYAAYEGNLSCAVSGYPRLLAGGQDALAGSMLPEDSMDDLHPRTAVGLRPDNTLVILCADGRSEASAGLSYRGMQQLFREFGCTEAMNLDGGGSTTVVTTAETGALHVCNVVSDPVLRPVADALLITARD